MSVPVVVVVEPVSVLDCVPWQPVDEVLMQEMWPDALSAVVACVCFAYGTVAAASSVELL